MEALKNSPKRTGGKWRKLHLPLGRLPFCKSYFYSLCALLLLFAGTRFKIFNIRLPNIGYVHTWSTRGRRRKRCLPFPGGWCCQETHEKIFGARGRRSGEDNLLSKRNELMQKNASEVFRISWNFNTNRIGWNCQKEVQSEVPSSARLVGKLMMVYFYYNVFLDVV